MKKYAILVMIMQISYSFLYSQDLHSKIGLVAGPSIFSIRGNFDHDNDNFGTLSYTTGMCYERYLSDKFSIQFNLLFASDYFNHINTLDASGSPIKRRLEYKSIFIPISSQIYIGRNKYTSFGLGVFSSVLISAKDKSKIPENANLDLWITDNYRTANLGLSMQIGHKFPVSKRMVINFSIENNFGLRDIYSSNNDIINSDTTPGIDFILKTNNLKILCGLSYSLKSKPLSN